MMPERTISEQKQQIRQEYKNLRAALDNSYRLAATKKILGNFEKFVKSQANIKTIGLYWPINSEIDIMPLAKQLNLHGFKCALPRISGDGMNFVIYNENSTMNKSKFAFYEPNGSEIVIPDIVAVPLLTCDTQRNRLGYGKGFYDRYLRQNKTFSLGVSYDTLLYKNTLPQEEHDIQLNALITESRILVESH